MRSKVKNIDIPSVCPVLEAVQVRYIYPQGVGLDLPCLPHHHSPPVSETFLPCLQHQSIPVSKYKFNKILRQNLLDPQGTFLQILS